LFNNSQDKVKTAYKNKFMTLDDDSIVILDHLMEWAGITKYYGGGTLEELTRMNERQRFVHSLFKHILDVSPEDMREKIIKKYEKLAEEQYNVQ